MKNVKGTTRFTRADRKYIRQNYQTQSDPELAKAIGASKSQVQKMRTSMKLVRDHKVMKKRTNYSRKKTQPQPVNTLPPIPKGYKPSYQFHFDPCLMDVIKIRKLVLGTYGR